MIFFVSFFLSLIVFFEFNVLIFKEKNLWKNFFSSLQMSLFNVFFVCFIFFQRFSISMEKLLRGDVYYLRFIFSSVVVMIAILIIRWSVYKILINHKISLSSSSLKQKLIVYGLSIVFFISILIVTSSYWLVYTFGKVDIEQLVYTASNSLSGSSTQQIFTFVDGPLLTSLFTTSCFIIIVYILINCLHVFKITFSKIVKGFLSICFPLLMISLAIVIGISQFGFNEVKAYVLEQSTLIEKEYVDASKTTLTFPEKKRNLIYIFVESFEGTYTSEELGGAMENNLLNGLVDYPDSVNFSNTDKIGGALTFPGTDYTVAAMVSQTAGIPLKVPISAEDLNPYIQSETESTNKFLPGITSLGDLLQKKGYVQTLIMGSESSFGGRKQYFSEHGEYKIIDYDYASENQLIPEGYMAWWGFEDEKLFAIAKDEALELSNGSEPFNLTILTADTHFEDGYFYDSTPVVYDDQYSNVISFTSDQLISFLDWCKQQAFYDNTTIIVSGDHLSMDQDFFDNISSKYTRNVFNLFINQPNIAIKEKNRQFSTMDLFPTTLRALGVKIEGSRLGLGTDLFSGEETLTEKYGYETLYHDLSLRSSFYTEKLFK